MAKLSGKTAIITGGARGMGAVTAKLFVEEGATVVITDILEEEGKATAKALGERAIFVRHDVSKEADWERVIAAALEAFGSINILINNAGIVSMGLIEKQGLDVWEHTLGINLVGPAMGHRFVIPHMEAAGGGSIVNVSSTEGLEGKNGVGAYAASKWGLRGFTKVAAYELGPRGIRVNSIHPGPINTKIANPMDAPAEVLNPLFTYYPLQRLGEPEEVARLNLFLACDDSSFITGAEISVDGGSSAGRYLKMLPGAPDNLM
jgi:3alpha(or 20beta)-hydroxysteroid dehydrogenase